MATEKRLIDPRFLKSQMYMICTVCDTENIFIDAIIDEIDNAPDVDAVEVVHGRLIPSIAEVDCICSVCRSEFDNILSKALAKWNYCPNCGAKMDGERKDNET